MDYTDITIPRTYAPVVFVDTLSCQRLVERNDIGPVRHAAYRGHTKELSPRPLLTPRTRPLQTVVGRGLAVSGDSIEITMEGNPTSIEATKLEAFRRAGVNRLSLGKCLNAGL